MTVTGATGFLGTAIVERLLRSVPDCHVSLVVRPGRTQSAHRRAHRNVLRNAAFGRLREQLGDDFDAEVERRVSVLAGDVGRDDLGLDPESRERFAESDVVIHSAATVAFDAPIDRAVEVNLLGPTRVARVLEETGSTAHLIAVSTCYVAGGTKGGARERPPTDTPFVLDVDWRSEVDFARRIRADTEAASRDPEQLEELAREARAELGAVSSSLLAARAERARERWVRDRMEEAGRSRARSLGWPDVYAYTKALGERALLESRGRRPVTIVRPSIIESALAEPDPGWIRGFRMAEPLIISYGRGVLRQFPGTPEGIIDVIPVDMVVGAILAVAARGPDPDGPDVYQVASGAVNPLRYRRLVELVREWFTEHPLHDDRGRPIAVPELTYPGHRQVEQRLGRATRLLRGAERTLSRLPLRRSGAELSTRVAQRRSESEQLLSYARLYGAYAQTEAVFEIDRLLGLWESLDDTDRSAFHFDPRTIDWSRYLHEIHLPSVVRHARVRGRRGRAVGARSDRQRRTVLAPERQMAVFDLENTLIASNVVESYVWLAGRDLTTRERARLVARVLRDVPSLMALDRRDRGAFLRAFYRRYEGAPRDRLERDTWEMFSHLMLAKSFPGAIRRVREHRRRGHRTVLVTGALDFVVAPFRPLFDDVVSAHLDGDGTTFEGRLVETPPTGEARALALMDYAEANGISLSESVAYADSASDLPMLESVSFPVAVNPESRLSLVAHRRGWLVERWDTAPGTARPLLPLPPRPRRTPR